MNLIEVAGIGKQEGSNTILQDISFALQPLQKMAIAGASGSGKTTLLKIIAGLIQPDSGEVLFEQQKVEGPLERLIPGHPGIAYLSQHFELRNNYRVEEILEYANELSDAAASSIFEVCRISHLLHRRTDQLSGGERQRIALARLLIGSPRLLLLDEPFSNLDMTHRNMLKSVIDGVSNLMKITCILVSHDPLDILSWADEIQVLKEGRLIQNGTPENIYRKPVDEYTAGLFGKYNLINEDTAKLFPSLQQLELNDRDIMIRPEDVIIKTGEGEGVKGIVSKLVYLGSHSEAEVLLPDGRITINTGHSNLKKGNTVYITVSPESVWYV